MFDSDKHSSLFCRSIDDGGKRTSTTWTSGTPRSLPEGRLEPVGLRHQDHRGQERPAELTDEPGVDAAKRSSVATDAATI